MVWATVPHQVITANQAPVWISRPVTNALVGQAYEYFLHATDPDGDAVDYLPVTVPAWLGIAEAPEPRIYTVAGTLERGNGKPALQVQLASPSTGAYDAAGNLFVADMDNHRVWKLAPDGTMTVIAGTGEPGFSGDGGAALRARLSSPIGVTVDNQGNVFIADRDNHRVRRVSSAGLIITVAGTGEPGFSGDGGPAQAARLHAPSAVAWSPAGRLYIADTENHRVREISPTGLISTFAGTGDTAFNGDGIPATAAALWAPSGLAVPPHGQVSLLIADTAHNRVRRVMPSGLIETVAGTGTAGFSGDNGPATQARLDNPRGLAASTSGVWIADTRNNRIRRVAPDGTIATVAGIGRYGFRGDGGPATEAWMVLPHGVALTPANTFLVFDTYNARLREVNAAGVIQTVAGTGTPGSTGDGGPATAATFNQPLGLAAGPGGVVYVADSQSHRVRRITSDGTIITVAGTGVGGDGGDGGPGVEAQLFNPAGLALDAAGNLYIADQGNHRIRRLGTDGIIARFAGTGEPGYGGSGGLAILAKLRDPYGVAFDAAGNLYVTELGNHRVRRIGPEGIIHDVAGTGESGYSGDGGPATAARLNHPQGVAVDAAGNLYIADSDNHRIRKVGVDGKINTIAGTGVAGFSGDGAAATAARLNYPVGLALDTDGSLFVADYWNHRIRQVLPNGRITTVIGSGNTGPAGGGYSGDGGPPALAMMLYPTDVKLAADGELITVETRLGVVRRVFTHGKVLHGTPTAAAAGAREVAVQAVAGGLAATQTFALVVETPPAITLQPRSQVAMQGARATFVVEASGSSPLNYQWLRNGAALSDFGRFGGTATPQLTIENAQPEDAGTYAVQVLNPGGSVLSAAVQLTVDTNVPPTLSQAGLRNGQIVLLVSGPAGRRCEIESAPDFANWVKLTEVTLAAAPVEVTDRVTGRVRFYRALIR